MTSSPSTSSAAATRASRSAPPALDEERTIPDTSGPISPAPFAFYDPSGHCWRTSQGTFLLDSTPSSPTWPRSGMTRSGSAYQRQPLVRLTSGGGSLWLHTPTAKANQASPSMRSRDPGSWFPTPDASVANLGETLGSWEARREREKAKHRNGNGFGMPLAIAVQYWPTPTSSDGTGGPGCSGREGGDNLRTAVGGQLNPTWVEWLMGFPLGWTDCEPSATP
jgi:hypothetical protein